MKHTIYTSKHKLWWGIIIGGTNLSMTSYFISADPWSSLAYSGHNKKRRDSNAFSVPLSFEFSFYSLMVYSTNPRTSPHTSTKRREGINPKENALKPQLISITITYNTSSLARPIKLRLTAPNWERPSPDYGSHIIMSITGIYLRISIHTQYHLQVLCSIQVHEITYFIIHITHFSSSYICTSALFGSLAPNSCRTCVIHNRVNVLKYLLHSTSSLYNRTLDHWFC